MYAANVDQFGPKLVLTSDESFSLSHFRCTEDSIYLVQRVGFALITSCSLEREKNTTNSKIMLLALLKLSAT